MFNEIRQELVFPGSATKGKVKISQKYLDFLVDFISANDDIGNSNRIFLLSGEALPTNGKSLHTVSNQYWLLYFYGNGMCLNAATFEFDYFRKLGLNVVVSEYIGFGMSSGVASESGCYETARIAYKYLTQAKGISPDRIIVAGWSLGAAVAMYLARIESVAGLILLSAFTNIPDAAAKIFSNASKVLIPKFLIALAIPERFDNLKRISQIKCPIFISHGTNDELVPFTMAQTLKNKAEASHKFVSFLPIFGATHNNLFVIGGEQLQEGISNFIANLLDRDTPKIDSDKIVH